MREIKFRGWSMHEERWVYGYPIVKFNKRGNKKDYFIYPEPCISGWSVDPESVGQYIGVKDSLNNEIYEHDIVKIECMYEDLDFEDCIEWVGGDYPAFELQECPGEEVNGIFQSVNDRHIEVIGNKYEKMRAEGERN